MARLFGARPVHQTVFRQAACSDALEQSDVLGYQPPLPLNLVTPAHAQHMGGRKDTRDHAQMQRGKHANRRLLGAGRVDGGEGTSVDGRPVRGRREERCVSDGLVGRRGS